MASEDSDQAVPGCPPVHRFNHLCNFDETISFMMQALIDHPHTASKLFKICLLSRMQGMSLEERYDRSQKILPPVDNELSQVLTMIVVPLHDIDTTNAKKALQLFKRSSAADTLRHDNRWATWYPVL